jgi:hypothetical protein
MKPGDYVECLRLTDGSNPTPRAQGVLWCNIEDGKSLCIISEKEGEVDLLNLFRTSLVAAHTPTRDGVVVHTLNSTYLVRPKDA